MRVVSFASGGREGGGQATGRDQGNPPVRQSGTFRFARLDFLADFFLPEPRFPLCWADFMLGQHS